MNEIIERDSGCEDAPHCDPSAGDGKHEPRPRMVVSLVMMIGGAGYLGLTTNWLTAALSLMTSMVYLMAYTPLKKIHPICTTIGAFPGAMPPVLGWTAIRGRLDWEARRVVRDPLLLAVPALPFHRVALSRRL